MEVSVFRGFNQVVENLNLSVILEQIRDGRFAKEVQILRDILNKGNVDEYKKKKKSMLAFTPSATFEGGRKPEFMQEYTQCIILDIDGLQPEMVDTIRKKLEECPYTYSCFKSPSNVGLKVLVWVDSSFLFHKPAFFEVFRYYENLLGIELDDSGQDLGRLCFFSHDADIYINSNYQTFKTSVNMLNEDIEKVVQQIESHQIDITNDYKDWVKIGFALADGLGEGGRDYFHRVSKFYSAYDFSECDNQFDKCLKSKKSGITARSFFGYAKDHGIDISPVKSFDFSKEEKQENSEKPKEEAKKKKRANKIEIIENYLNSRYVLRFNVVTDKLEVRSLKKPDFVPITDYIENSILRELLKNNVNCTINKLRNLLCSDFCRRYDPFVDYFNGLPAWDGETDYINQLAKTITTSNDELWQKCFKKWIVAATASVLVPRIVNHTAIVFSGPQGIGKTTWLENLCPPGLKHYMFSGTINPNNKDTLIHLAECFYINLDEMENMNRTEIGTLKEIITKLTICIRRAYGHNSENLVRRASFMGSVNTSQFLNDTTGSRRFLCFEVTEIDYKHSVDIDLVYAQALALFNAGFKFYFDKEEIVEISDNNEQYQIRTSEEELLLTYYRPESKDSADLFLSASAILTRIAEKAKVSVTTGAVISLGKALKKHGFEKVKKGGVYVWAVYEYSSDEVAENTGNKEKMPF